ncbi:MAG: response regulator, partial [Lachnospiraceae bacterium]|nr:response regulator [Lachnospiraceae bacterium]
DFLIIDWSNPGANICESIERLRVAAGREAGITAVTVYDWSSIAKSAKNAGLDTFISKPVFTSDLERGLLSSMGEAEVVVNSNDHNADVRANETRLLVVEDNELNREIAIAVLESAGFIVETANDGSEAIEKIKESEPGRYNVILMDIQMPVMDGYEATREIRRLDRPDAATIPIIAMTANAFEEDKRRAASCGMNDHIAKPIEVDLLISTISKYL